MGQIIRVNERWAALEEYVPSDVVIDIHDSLNTLLLAERERILTVLEPAVHTTGLGARVVYMDDILSALGFDKNGEA